MKSQIVTMKYRIYKAHYPKAETIPDSYSSRDKTIDVVLDEKQAEEYHLNVEEILVPVSYRIWKHELKDQGYYYKKDSYSKLEKTVLVYMATADAMGKGLI